MIPLDKLLVVFRIEPQWNNQTVSRTILNFKRNIINNLKDTKEVEVGGV